MLLLYKPEVIRSIMPNACRLHTDCGLTDCFISLATKLLISECEFILQMHIHIFTVALEKVSQILAEVEPCSGRQLLRQVMFISLVEVMNQPAYAVLIINSFPLTV